jgi:phage N-6-adenine-methyltransferase
MVDLNSALFTSNSDEWATPQDFYDMLNAQFQFNLDPCATEENHKCKKYFTIEDDGLKQDWSGYTTFVNPPYSDIARWIKKCHDTIISINCESCVVALIPSRTDTKYWHEHVMKAGQIYFVRGRLKFGNAKNYAPFPSAVVVWSSYKSENYLVVDSLERRLKKLIT